MAESSSINDSMPVDDENFGSHQTQGPELFGVNNDGMDIDDQNDREIVKSGSVLRRKSLLLATFPWFSGVIMTPSKLCEELGPDHYAYVCLPFLFSFFFPSLFL
jgi:hypothetical protein